MSKSSRRSKVRRQLQFKHYGPYVPLDHFHPNNTQIEQKEIEIDLEISTKIESIKKYSPSLSNGIYGVYLYKEIKSVVIDVIDDYKNNENEEYLPTAGVEWNLSLKTAKKVSIMYSVDIQKSYPGTFFANWFPEGYIGVQDHSNLENNNPSAILFSLWDVTEDQNSENPVPVKVMVNDAMDVTVRPFGNETGGPGIQSFIPFTSGVAPKKYTFKVDFETKESGGIITGSFITDEKPYLEDNFGSLIWKTRWMTKFIFTTKDRWCRWMRYHRLFNNCTAFHSFVEAFNPGGVNDARIGIFRYVKVLKEGMDPYECFSRIMLPNTIGDYGYMVYRNCPGGSTDCDCDNFDIHKDPAIRDNNKIWIQIGGVN